MKTTVGICLGVCCTSSLLWCWIRGRRETKAKLKSNSQSHFSRRKTGLTSKKKEEMLERPSIQPLAAERESRISENGYWSELMKLFRPSMESQTSHVSALQKTNESPFEKSNLEGQISPNTSEHFSDQLVENQRPSSSQMGLNLDDDNNNDNNWNDVSEDDSKWNRMGHPSDSFLTNTSASVLHERCGDNNSNEWAGRPSDESFIANSNGVFWAVVSEDDVDGGNLESKRNNSNIHIDRTMIQKKGLGGLPK